MTQNAATPAPVRVNIDAVVSWGWIIAIIGWLAGIAIAKGKLATAGAVVFAPYGWYLAVEAVLRLLGIIPSA